MNLLRAFRHLFATRWATRRRFTRCVARRDRAASRGRVAARRRDPLRRRDRLDLPELWIGLAPRQRALEVFGELGVWDTEANNGVLIYVLMADRRRRDRCRSRDRGPRDPGRVGRRVPRGRGPLSAPAVHRGLGRRVQAVGRLLARHFPARGGDRDEQPNQPVLL
jgi:hypothetical protein